MDKCGICDKPAVQLFETSNDGVYACFKCQPFVPEVTIEDSAPDPPDPSESQNSNTDEESNDKSLYCGICHKSFQKTMQLQNHMRNHRAERRFVCTYCNKAFSQSNNLRAHLRIHTNERPFKCNECGKAFTQVTNLNNHVRLHTGERPFVCPEPGCNKAYAQAVTFKVEVVSDDDETGLDTTSNTVEEAHDDKMEQADCTQQGKEFFRAPIAGMTNNSPPTTEYINRETCVRLKFLQSKQKAEMQLLKAQVTNLNQHRKRHLNGRPVEATYDCNVCGEQFQQRNHMYSHRRTAHPEFGTPGQRCGICDAVLPNERLLRLHVMQHAQPPAPDADHDSKAEEAEEEEEGETEAEAMTCVFSSCGAVVRSARDHTEHLLRAHQLRVLAAPAARAPAKRGRPPKHTAQVIKDPLDLTDFQEIKIMRSSTQPQYIPKLKVKSLFQ